MKNFKICDLFTNCGVLNDFPFPIDDFDSLTQYEMLIKCINHIKKLYTNDKTLTNRIDALANYLANLDLQDEVDNKLEEMAESGELAAIIAEFLNSNAVLGFDNIASMKASENLIVGSICKTLGKTNATTGDGSYYRVRNVLTTDVIDDDNIVSITSDNTIVAVKIPDYYINNLTTKVSSIENNLSDDIVVLLGDSYGVHNAHATHDWYSWADKLASMRGWTEGVNYFNFCTGNSGLTVTSNNYYTNLINNENRITDKTKVKTFIIAGGFNDNYYFSGSNSDSDYDTALSQLTTYINNNYPNAKIYMGMIGNSKALNGTGIRSIMINNALYGYSKIENLPNGHYINNIECVMHRYDYFIDDNTHPNENGASMLAKAINDSVYGSGFVPIFDKANIQFSSANINVRQNGSNLEISLTGSCYPTILVSSNSQITFTSNYTIGDTSKYLRSVNEVFTNIPFVALATCSDNTTSMVRGQIFIKSDNGTLIFKIEPTASLVGKTIGRLDFKYESHLLPIIYF